MFIESDFVNLPLEPIFIIMIAVETLIKAGGIYKEVLTDEIIVEEEGKCYFYFQLVTGRLRAVNINDKSREYLQYIVHPGETFAEIPLVIDSPFQVTIIADEPSTIIKLPLAQFESLLTEYPEYQKGLSRILAKRLIHKYLISKEYFNHNPQHRIFSLLEYIKNEGKDICPECNKIGLTRQQIADMLGFRVETVIRAMRDLHEKKLIEIKGGKVFFPILKKV